MASFQIREDSAENKSEKVIIQRTTKNEGERRDVRAPFRSLTNSTWDADSQYTKVEEIEKHSEKERSVQNGENKQNPSVNLDCLKLIGKENIPAVKKYYDELELYTPADIICNIEYGSDIWNYLCKMEVKIPRPRPDYMRKQKDLTAEMRCILIDWLVAVAEDYKMSEHTLHLTVNYIDRFLSHMSVIREKFQLVGTAAMMLATKVEEVNILQPEEWILLSSEVYTVRQIIRMEQLLLKVLNFDLNTPTAVSFIQQLGMVHSLDKRTLFMAMFLSELVLLEGGHFIEYLPSKVAAASIVLARSILNKKKPYYKKLESFTGYKLEDLNPVIQSQYVTYRDSPTKTLQAIQNKYKGEKYCQVGEIAPVPLRLKF